MNYQLKNILSKDYVPLIKYFAKVFFHVEIAIEKSYCP